jgi:hypothetical protein
MNRFSVLLFVILLTASDHSWPKLSYLGAKVKIMDSLGQVTPGLLADARSFWRSSKRFSQNQGVQRVPIPKRGECKWLKRMAPQVGLRSA